MPNALTTASSMTCPHGGKISATPKSTKVKIAGAPVLTSGDQFQIMGCSFTLPNGTPSPCVVIQWLKADLKSKADDGATLSEASVGLCKAGSGVPQGKVIVAATQPKGQTT
jgi:hypothetical protein